MRAFILTLIITILPLTAWAVEAPAGQIRIKADKVLRGNFEQEHQVKLSDNPILSSGAFVVAPSHGLIWNITKPFPTSTVVSQDNAAQVVGGLVVKLPVKNLRRLYDMVGGALAGDWSKLEQDFVIKRSGSAEQWQMLLTPKPGRPSPLPYITITVSGGKFVENIVMTKADGRCDTLSFSNAVLTAAPPTAQEVALFDKVGM